MEAWSTFVDLFMTELKDYLFYQDDWATIYCADCRDILPMLEPVDLVLTDPPYEGFSQFENVDLTSLPLPLCRSFIFWSASGTFPLPYTAVHVWHKPNGRSSEYYERIFEVNGQKVYKVFRYGCVDSVVAAQMLGDEYCGHPTQKPIGLIRELIPQESCIILDPFMGSGTTLVAAKNLNRKSIGIEIEPKYCEIAKKRLRQEVFDFRKKNN